MITKHTTCDNCKVDIRTLSRDNTDYAFCMKLECKVSVLHKHNLDYRAYVQPSDWTRAERILRSLYE